MELDTKESELENLHFKLQHVNIDTASLSSGTGDGLSELVFHEETSLEGWLQVPKQQNIRRHGWKKLYITVSSKKIIFFNSETERQNADPTLILDLKWVVPISCNFFTKKLRNSNDFSFIFYSKVFHVRSVTQGDVIRAEAKDIPRIFQVNHFHEKTMFLNISTPISKSISTFL